MTVDRYAPLDIPITGPLGQFHLGKGDLRLLSDLCNKARLGAIGAEIFVEVGEGSDPHIPHKTSPILHTTVLRNTNL